MKGNITYGMDFGNGSDETVYSISDGTRYQIIDDNVVAKYIELLFCMKRLAYISKAAANICKNINTEAPSLRAIAASVCYASQAIIYVQRIVEIMNPKPKTPQVSRRAV